LVDFLGKKGTRWNLDFTTDELEKVLRKFGIETDITAAPLVEALGEKAKRLAEFEKDLETRQERQSTQDEGSITPPPVPPPPGQIVTNDPGVQDNPDRQAPITRPCGECGVLMLQSEMPDHLTWHEGRRKAAKDMDLALDIELKRDKIAKLKGQTERREIHQETEIVEIKKVQVGVELRDTRPLQNPHPVHSPEAVAWERQQIANAESQGAIYCFHHSRFESVHSICFKENLPTREGLIRELRGGAQAHLPSTTRRQMNYSWIDSEAGVKIQSEPYESEAEQDKFFRDLATTRARQ
jgi:hypothetical protein